MSNANSFTPVPQGDIFQNSSDIFAIAFNHSPLALTITALDDGRLVAVNEAFIRTSGYTREEVLGRSPDELGLWVDPQRRADRFAELMTGQPVPEIEARFRLKNGDIRVGLIGSAIVEIGGRKCVLSSVLDITARTRAEERARENEERLRASEARYRAIVESQVEMVCRFMRDGEIRFVNSAYSRARGTTADELMGHNFWEFVDEADRAAVAAQLDSLTPEAPEVAIENRFETTEGVRWTLWTNRALSFDRDGRPTELQSSGLDITDRKMRESEAARANQIKDEFLATLSHELRTPLNAVLGWAHMLRKGNLPPELTAQALDALERNAQAQMQLVDDLLDMSRIISGNLPIRSEPVVLSDVAASAAETIRPTAENKGVNLEVDVASTPVLRVRGDADRLRQVLWNLVSNAVKFTPAGGDVHLRVSREGTDAVIVVLDTGEGIDPAFLPLVFERFRQADSTTTRRHSGLGLGLAIARHLVEAHDGTITAHSDGLDQGSTFTVRLPLAGKIRGSVGP